MQFWLCGAKKAKKIRNILSPFAAKMLFCLTNRRAVNSLTCVIIWTTPKDFPRKTKQALPCCFFRFLFARFGRQIRAKFLCIPAFWRQFLRFCPRPFANMRQARSKNALFFARYIPPRFALFNILTAMPNSR